MIVITMGISIVSAAIAVVVVEDDQDEEEMGCPQLDAIATKATCLAIGTQSMGKDEMYVFVLMLCLRRTIKWIRSAFKVGVCSPSTVVGRHAVNVGGEGGAERDVRFQFN